MASQRSSNRNVAMPEIGSIIATNAAVQKL